MRVLQRLRICNFIINIFREQAKMFVIFLFRLIKPGNEPRLRAWLVGVFDIKKYFQKHFDQMCVGIYNLKI